MAENEVVIDCKAVLIGGSTGSIDALLELLPGLRTALPFALIVVVHRKNSSDSTLANLLSLKTGLPVREVEDKDVLLPGTVYLAPADYHLLLEQDGTLSLDDSEKVNYSRPSIDVTFTSAVDVYGPGLVGVLLSGANADGTEGLKAIKAAGGIAVVQQPETAAVGFMPQHAIENLTVDHVLDMQQVTAFINTLTASVKA